MLKIAKTPDEMIYPSERTEYADPTTGARVIQWTRGPHKNHHLYFTSPSVTADDRWLVFISDRDGHPNLYVIDRGNGEIRRLSQNRSGLLRSYVYPQGGLAGFSKSSPCLDANSNRIYYIRDDAVHAAALDDPSAGERKIAALPAQWFTAYTHISPDGKTLCVPCADPRAFVDPAQTQWDQLRNVPARMKREKHITRVLLIDVDRGETRTLAEIPFWVTHVQFCPDGSGRIIFNQEGFGIGGGRPLNDRIWRLTPQGEYSPLGDEKTDEWRSHENWAPDGKSIVYHGAHGDHAYVAARTWEGDLIHEASMDGIACHHATGMLDGRRMLVDKKDGLIAIVDPFAKDHRVVDLCRHDTTIEDQDAHAHPITSPNGKSAVFTSIRAGTCNVYEVGI